MTLAPRHRLSGSRTELAEHCMFWARPDVDLGPGSGPSGASRLGSALHQGAETAELPADASPADAPDEEVDEGELNDVLRSAAAEPTADLDAIATKWLLTPSAREQLGELFSAWSDWWPGYLDGRPARREVPYAWNVRTWTARELPSQGQRDYSSATADEVTCTLDAVIVDRANDLVIVVDLKTGRGRHRPAGEHAQLAFGALCAAHVEGVSRARVVLAHVRDGAVWVDSADLDAWTLAGRAQLLQGQLEALPTAEPRPGPHCARLYCPALAVCAGPMALAKRAPELAQSLTVSIRSNEDAAAAIACVKPLQAFLDTLKRAAVEWAETHGGKVTMPDGTTLRRVQVGRRSLAVTNPRLIAELERALGGEGVIAVTKVKRTISVGAVEKAIKATAPRGKKEQAVAALMGVLESTGGVKESFHGEWKEDE